MSDLKMLQTPKEHIFDIFQGEGWEAWTRVLYDKKRKKLFHIGGLALDNKLHTTVLKRILLILNGNKNA